MPPHKSLRAEHSVSPPGPDGWHVSKGPAVGPGTCCGVLENTWLLHWLHEKGTSPSCYACVCLAFAFNFYSILEYSSFTRLC